MATHSTLRMAAKEGLVLTLISLSLALFYNGVTGKGIFSEARAGRSVAAPGPAPEIVPLERASELQRSGALFVDSRHAFDFRLGHIAGAVNIPLQDSDAAIAAMPEDRNRTIVVYCDGAECNSSLELGSKFSGAGYTKVFVFFAGWTAWKGAGMPIEGSPE